MLVTPVSIGLVGRVLRKSPADERRGEISSVVDWSMFDKPLPVFGSELQEVILQL